MKATPGISTAFVVTAAFFWGISGGIGGILISEGWSPLTLSIYRGGFGLVTALIWLGLHPARHGLASPRLWLWSALAGLGVAGNFTFYYISIRNGSVAVAATLMYCAPIFVYLVSFLLRLEKSTTYKWIGIGLVLVGIVLLTRLHEGQFTQTSLIGLFAGLGSGVSYAVFIFSFKNASQNGSPPAILSIAFAVLILALIIPAPSGQILETFMTPQWSGFLALGIFGATLSFALYIKGLKWAAPAVASIVAMVEPVTASLFGVIILGETLLPLQIVGIALILLTVTGLSVFPARR
ncbi:MAG: DMT family transporter [Puniceicoccales bacterium]